MKGLLISPICLSVNIPNLSFLLVFWSFLPRDIHVPIFILIIQATFRSNFQKQVNDNQLYNHNVTPADSAPGPIRVGMQSGVCL